MDVFFSLGYNNHNNKTVECSKYKTHWKEEIKLLVAKYKKTTLTPVNPRSMYLTLEVDCLKTHKKH